jgi:hypothetical protein
MRTYYIRRTEKPRSFCLRYEIVHRIPEGVPLEDRDGYSFDGYALTRWGARLRAKKYIFEDLIREI